MTYISDTTIGIKNQEFREAHSGAIILALLLGIAILLTPIILGRSYVYYISIAVLTFVMTILWRNNPRPLISLVSISTATPLAIAKQQFQCNLIFAFWYVLINTNYLFRLPKWLYIPSGMVLVGIFSSSVNWLSEDILRSFIRQSTYAYNFFFGPFLILPVLYLRMKDSHDTLLNLRGLLFFLIIPSSVLLLSAKLFGTIVNEWEASLHVSSLADGFYEYKLGKVIVNFLRTEVGFILSALIVASTAVVVSHVKGIYRLIALGCMLSNVFLLLSTGSFGSVFACLCGLLIIFLIQAKQVNVLKVISSLVVICLALSLSFIFAPESTKEYLEKRYEHRVVNADTDRVYLWNRAVDHFTRYPEGVGLTLSVGKNEKTYIHNDYLVYAVSYGLIGGLGYLILVVGLVLSFFRMRNSSFEDQSALAVYLAGLGVLISLGVNSITDHSNENRWYFNIIWSIIWYSYFCSLSVKEKS